jgi:hypothetical protein
MIQWRARCRASKARFIFRVILGEYSQHSNSPHQLGLLRARRERQRGCHTTNKAEKFAPPQIRSQAQETAF